MFASSYQDPDQIALEHLKRVKQHLRTMMDRFNIDLPVFRVAAKNALIELRSALIRF